MVINEIYPESIGNYLLPKLMLQPIVENCFKYGFAQSKENWLIEINIVDEVDRFLIIVKDNGIGIKPERLKYVQESLNDLNKDKYFVNDSIGLVNINNRIKLSAESSDEYGIKIDSVFEKYTKITAIIKKLKKEV